MWVVGYSATFTSLRAVDKQRTCVKGVDSSEKEKKT
jgi:hypothetical protein